MLLIVFRRCIFCLAFGLAVAHSSAQSPHPDLVNLAAGKSVQFKTAPNYAETTDPQDARQLVDGRFAEAAPIWYDRNTVGWSGYAAVDFVLDLGEKLPIGGAAVRVGAGEAGVEWPQKIEVLGSDDGVQFTSLGALAKLPAALQPKDSRVQWFGVADLKMPARFIKFLVTPPETARDKYVFLDEVEIYRGDDAWLDSPLLEASFDAGIDPDSAQGSKKAFTQGKILFTEGVKGKAALIGPDSAIFYRLSGNLNPLAGTLSFWAKTVDWTDQADQYRYFFSLIGDEDWIMLQTVGSDLTLLGGNRKTYTSPSTPIADWLRGGWHFVTATWDNGKARIYLDGRPATPVNTWPVTPEKLGSLIRLGGQVYGNATGQTAIDELKIYSARASEAQVKNLYEKALSASPELRARHEVQDQQQTLEPNNIARENYGAIVLPSSQCMQPEFAAESAIDGDFTTQWQSSPGTFPNWLEIRWPQPKLINKVVVNEGAAYRSSRYRVDVFQNGRWVNWVPEKQNVSQPGERIAETFKPVETDKIRFVMVAPDKDATPSNARSVVSELQVCSVDPVPDLSKLSKPGWRSQWIWYPETSAIDVSRYFRKHFAVADPAKIREAVLQIAGDDSFEVYLNGRRVGSGGIPTTQFEVAKFLVPGDNLLAVKCHQFSGFAGLIAELTLKAEEGTTQVITDQSWKSTSQAGSDWFAAGLDDSEWKNSAELGIPPNSPDHGNQVHFDLGGNDRFNVKHVTISPSEARPGDVVELKIEVETERAVSHDYAFSIRLGERNTSLFADFTVARTTFLPPVPTSQWKPQTPYILTTKVHLPDWAPHGDMPIFLSAEGPEADSIGAKGDGLVASLHVRKFENEPKPWSPDPPKAEVRRENGHPTLFVNGKVLPPQILTENTYASYQALGEQAKTGIHFWRTYAVRGRDTKFYPDDKARELAELCAVFDQYIQAVLKVDPEAYILPGTTFNVSQEWTEKYPDDAALLGDGHRVQHSFSSGRWIGEVKGDIDVLVKHLMSQSYSGHIVGLHFGIGAGPETYYWGLGANAPGTPREKLVLGDFSPEHLRAFQEWLRARYHNDEAALGAAWKDTSVTFATARPDPDTLRREDLMMFRDPALSRMPLDYWEFHSDVMASRVIDIGSAIKQASGGRFITGCWGLYSNGMNALTDMPGRMHQSAYAGLQKVLDSSSIDYLAMLQEYLNVRWGTPMVPDNLTESIRRHDKLCLIEYDMRTFFTPTQFTERTFSQQETLSVIRRDIAAAAVRGDGLWWVGFPEGTTGRISVPWFAEESVLGELTRGRKIYNACYQQDLTSTSEIAVFINNADVPALDVAKGQQLLATSQFSTWGRELTKIGAPFDQYQLDDISLPGMDRYKVYFFLNAFNLTKERREAIHRQLANSGKTVVWLYAPGFSDGTSLSTRSIADLTGFEVSMDKRWSLPEVEINPGHAFTSLVPKGHRLKPRPYEHQSSPFEIGPLFDITDTAAEPLGRYVDNGKVACAYKKQGNVNAIYMAIPFMDATVARSICQAAGVHLYADGDVYLDATKHLMTITATQGAFSGKINLSSPSLVYDVFQDRIVAENAAQFEANVSPLSTSLYYFGTKEETDSFIKTLH